MAKSTLSMFNRSSKSATAIAPKGVLGMVQQAKEEKKEQPWGTDDGEGWLPEREEGSARAEQDHRGPLHQGEDQVREERAAEFRNAALEARYGLQPGRLSMTAETSAREVAEATHTLNQVLARASSPREAALAAAAAQAALMCPGAAKALMKGVARSAGYPALDAVWMTASVDNLREQVAAASRAGRRDVALEERMFGLERRVEEGFAVARTAGTVSRVLEAVVPEEVRGETLSVVIGIVRGRTCRKAAKAADPALASRAWELAAEKWRKQEEVLKSTAEAILGTLTVPAGSTVLRDPQGNAALVGATEKEAKEWLLKQTGVTKVALAKAGGSFRVTVEVEEEGEDAYFTTAPWAWETAREVKFQGVKWQVKDGTWKCRIFEVGQVPPLKDGEEVFDV